MTGWPKALSVLPMVHPSHVPLQHLATSLSAIMLCVAGEPETAVRVPAGQRVWAVI